MDIASCKYLFVRLVDGVKRLLCKASGFEHGRIQPTVYICIDELKLVKFGGSFGPLLFCMAALLAT